MKINSWLRTTGFVDLGLGLGLVDCIATSGKALYRYFWLNLFKLFPPGGGLIYETDGDARCLA